MTRITQWKLQYRLKLLIHSVVKSVHFIPTVLSRRSLTGNVSPNLGLLTDIDISKIFANKILL